MQCDVQSLLDDGRCFAEMSPRRRQAVIAQLLCNVAIALSESGDNAAIQSVDDSQWYEVRGFLVSPGKALVMMGQVAMPAGANAYLVLEDPDTGDKYKFSAVGTPPNVEWELDDTPTVEPATPTVITVGAEQFDLLIRQDPGPVPVLEPV